MRHSSTKIKVTLGYAAFTVLVICTILYIRHEIGLFAFNDSQTIELGIRRKTTNDIVHNLYRAEIFAQSLHAGQTEQYAEYTAAMRKAYTSIDSLAFLSADSAQIARIDTIRTLLKEKDTNIQSALRMTAHDKTIIEETYRKEIAKIVSNKDSMPETPYIRHKTVTQTKSYNTPNKRKGFFKRLAEVFVPAHKDSVTVNDATTEEYVDTLYDTHIQADSVSHILKGVYENMEEANKIQQKEKERMLHKLQTNSLKLNQKINSLLYAIETEEKALIQAETEKQETLRRNSAKILAGISVTAILLAGIFLFAILRDITRSNRYKTELERAKEKAENLLVEREKLMLAVTHDIKAPVGSIIGYIDLLKRIITDERQNVYVSNMESSAKHLLSLVCSLLDYHRLDANKTEKHSVAFNPHEVLESAYMSHQPYAEKKRLQLNYVCSNELNGIYIGDPFSIRQIIDNLMSNALKFTDKGEITLSGSIENGHLQISVNDTGCGISEKEYRQVFKEFTRLNSAQGKEGFGLGLSITKKLVHLLGGEIGVKSKVDKGSCFYVSIPIKKRDAKPIPSDDIPKEKESDTESIRTIHAIIIDDDRIQLHLTTAMLNSTPHISVTVCEHPEELFQQLQEKTFDVILTDIQMPSMNGFELLEKVKSSDKERGKSLPVIAITARCDMDENFLCEKGFAGSLNKPFTRKELQEVIYKVCRTDIPNFSAMTAFAMDDKEAAEEIIQTFISETENNLSQMKQMESEGNRSAIASIAHKMRPMFVMLNASQCAETLEQLECLNPAEMPDEKIRSMVETVITESQIIIQKAHQFKIEL
ncbi:MAG: ATP-binding protein [Bacteroides sp.]|nr:ATP-binding protein [Roseburia sp.]MCM1345868.1 ATP-binding protein [Bacteroides sp.]MCM1421704.1 ATP-binding protein [Bacteroides sp.]